MRRMLAAALLCLLCACAETGKSLPTLPAALPDGTYRLDSDDRVRVHVFGQPELSGEYRVNDAGYLSIPLVGLVPARGYTTYQLGVQLAQQLTVGGYISNPSVSVEVAQYRPFFILGEVPFTRPVSLCAGHDGPDCSRDRRWLHVSRRDGLCRRHPPWPQRAAGIQSATPGAGAARGRDICLQARLLSTR